jgi:hypothetical protein
MTQFHARFARVECEVVFGFQGPRVAEERRAMAADDVGPSYAKVGLHLFAKSDLRRSRIRPTGERAAATIS